jgi:hypothetical protein
MKCETCQKHEANEWETECEGCRLFGLEWTLEQDHIDAMDSIHVGRCFWPRNTRDLYTYRDAGRNFILGETLGLTLKVRL